MIMGDRTEMVGEDPGFLYIREDGLWMPFKLIDDSVTVERENLAFYHIKQDTLFLCDFPPTEDLNCSAMPAVIEDVNSSNIVFSMSNSMYQPFKAYIYSTRSDNDQAELDTIVARMFRD